jgi:hypothetical protein
LRSLPVIASSENVARAMEDLNRSRQRAAAAWAAAGAAAWDVLKPVTAQLQDSVLSPGGLLDRMLPTEVVQIPVVSEWREIVGVA